MPTSAASTHFCGHRYLVVLPIAIKRADGPRAGSGEDHGRRSTPEWQALAAGARALSGGPWPHRRTGTRYGSYEHGASWLLLASGHTEAETLDLTWQVGARYRLSLACAEVSGCLDQQLTVALTGGASARSTFAIPANRSCHDGTDFTLCTLGFTPASQAAITVRLTNSVARVSTPAFSARSCLRV